MRIRPCGIGSAGVYQKRLQREAWRVEGVWRVVGERWRVVGEEAIALIGWATWAGLSPVHASSGADVSFDGYVTVSRSTLDPPRTTLHVPHLSSSAGSPACAFT